MEISASGHAMWRSGGAPDRDRDPECIYGDGAADSPCPATIAFRGVGRSIGRSGGSARSLLGAQGSDRNVHGDSTEPRRHRRNREPVQSAAAVFREDAAGRPQRASRSCGLCVGWSGVTGRGNRYVQQSESCCCTAKAGREGEAVSYSRHAPRSSHSAKFTSRH